MLLQLQREIYTCFVWKIDQCMQQLLTAIEFMNRLLCRKITGAGEDELASPCVPGSDDAMPKLRFG